MVVVPVTFVVLLSTKVPFTTRFPATVMACDWVVVLPLTVRLLNVL